MAIFRIFSELSTEDIQIDPDVLVLKGVRFYRPYITAAAINEDTIAGNGKLGGIMLAQTSPHASMSTGLQGIDEQVFIVKDEAQEKWDAVKSWLRQTEAKVLETRIPNEKFTTLFPL